MPQFGNTTPLIDTHPAAHNTVYDVKSMYGAVGNGSTDDTTAIQAAIDAANAAGGGVVLLPPGTFIGANIVLKPRVTLRGSGVRATTLTLKNSAGAGADVVKGLNFATLTGKAYAAGDYALGTYEAVMENLTIDGNKVNNATGGYGIRIWGRANTFRNVEVVGTHTGGIWTEFTEISNFLDPVQVLEARHGDVWIHDSDGYGWIHRGPHDTTCKSLTIWDCGDWAVRVEMTAGGYTGGLTVTTLNTFLVPNSLYASAYVALLGGTLSGGAGGIGVQLDAGAGNAKMVGVLIGDHATGMKLAAQNCVIDVILSNCSADGIEFLTGNGWNSIRVCGAGNANSFKFTANSGPNHVVGYINLTAGETLSTGTGNSSADYLALTASGAGGQVRKYQLPTNEIQVTGGYPVRLFGLTALLTDAATVAVDASAGDYFTLDTANSRAIGTPSNANGMQIMTIQIHNTSGGTITPTYSGAYNLVGAAGQTIAAGKAQAITFRFNPYTSRWIEIARTSGDITLT